MSIKMFVYYYKNQEVDFEKSVYGWVPTGIIIKEVERTLWNNI